MLDHHDKKLKWCRERTQLKWCRNLAIHSIGGRYLIVVLARENRDFYPPRRFQGQVAHDDEPVCIVSLRILEREALNGSP